MSYGVIMCCGALLFHGAMGFGAAWVYLWCALFVVVVFDGPLQVWFVCARVSLHVGCFLGSLRAHVSSTSPRSETRLTLYRAHQVRLNSNYLYNLQKEAFHLC